MELNTAHLLVTWEQGLRRSSNHRALLLLSTTFPETLEQLASLSVGERNRRLLLLRQKLFGVHADAMVNCPECKERLEFTLPLADFMGEAKNDVEPFSVTSGSYVMRVRLPNSLDLLALPNDVARARAFLL
jgi:hypothetical protein